jgi:hypothetical protein
MQFGTVVVGQLFAPMCSGFNSQLVTGDPPLWFKKSSLKGLLAKAGLSGTDAVLEILDALGLCFSVGQGTPSDSGDTLYAVPGRLAHDPTADGTEPAIDGFCRPRPGCWKPPDNADAWLYMGVRGSTTVC